MLELKQRLIFFLLGCIPSRILLVFLAKKLKNNYLRFFGLLLAAISISFLVLYFGNLRIKAPESGGNTWWANLRLIHGLLYMTAAIYALQNKSIAWIPLTIDLVFGLSAFLYHHYMLNNFYTLIQ